MNRQHWTSINSQSQNICVDIVLYWQRKLRMRLSDNMFIISNERNFLLKMHQKYALQRFIPCLASIEHFVSDTLFIHLVLFSSSVSHNFLQPMYWFFHQTFDG